MAHLATAFTALRARIATVWPETEPNGIYHVVELSRHTLDRVTLPCVAFDMATSSGSPFADMASGVDDTPLLIHYVASDALDLFALVAKLEALRDSLWSNRDLGAAGAQVAAYPGVSFSTDLPLLRYFLATQRPYMTGAVLVRLVSGEGP